jgi:hypothetical protein
VRKKEMRMRKIERIRGEGETKGEKGRGLVLADSR